MVNGLGVASKGAVNGERETYLEEDVCQRDVASTDDGFGVFFNLRADIVIIPACLVCSKASDTSPASIRKTLLLQLESNRAIQQAEHARAALTV